MSDASALVAWLREYGERHVRSQLWDERRSFPPHVISDLGRRGVFAMQIPERYGGRPLDQREALRVVEQIAAIDTTLASLVGVSLALGARPIVRHGSAEAKERYLPELARGTMLGGLALTEPGAGSDPRAIEARADPIDADRFALHGIKSWIGNASWAGVINVFVRGSGGASEIAGYCVARDAPGVIQGPEALTMGMRAMVQNELRLEGVVVESRDRLGERGRGLDVLHDTLGYGRLGICAIALGAMERAVQLAHRYASRRRVASGLLLSNLDARRYFFDAAGAIAIASGVLDHACAWMDRSEAPYPDALLIAAKIVVPELAFEIVDGALQRLGGRGYVETNELPRLFRDVRLLRIFEGPTEAMASHLGALAFAHAEAIARLLDPDDGAWLRQRIDDLHGQLRSCTDRRELLTRDTFALGLWCAHALLARVCESERATAVLHARRERLLSRARGGALHADEVESLAIALRASIGDLDPRTAGEDRVVDPLLRRGG